MLTKKTALFVSALTGLLMPYNAVASEKRRDIESREIITYITKKVANDLITYTEYSQPITRYEDGNSAFDFPFFIRRAETNLGVIQAQDKEGVALPKDKAQEVYKVLEQKFIDSKISLDNLDIDSCTKQISKKSIPWLASNY